MKRFEEALYTDLADKGYFQAFDIDKVIVDTHTGFQHVLIFESPFFGRVLVLDGIVQATEKDEFFYHEMMTHPPILAHGTVRDALIIGGGDGGSLRKVLRHPGVRATLVEIDGDVVALCREHMPALGAGAIDDARAELIIGDGLKFVAETNRRFDVVIVDSTDPVGPGEVLFTEEFYGDCRRVLRPGGVLVTQNGVPFFQADEITTTWRRLSAVFADTTFYTVAVPTYVGGVMTLAWGSDNPALRGLSEGLLGDRFAAAGLTTRYYNPAIHNAAFVLPNFITDLMVD